MARRPHHDITQSGLPKRRGGRLVVHLNRQTAGWRIVHPRVTPEVCDPDLASAKARALPIALAALPLHPATRRANAIANRLPSSSHLLTLQALPPEQRKTAPVEVLDAARFSIPVNLLGGHRFANAPRLDWDTLKTIVAPKSSRYRSPTLVRIGGGRRRCRSVPCVTSKNGLLAVTCDLDAIASDLDADQKAEAKRYQEAAADLMQGLARLERTKLTDRLAEIAKDHGSRC